MNNPNYSPYGHASRNTPFYLQAQQSQQAHADALAATSSSFNDDEVESAVGQAQPAPASINNGNGNENEGVPLEVLLREFNARHDREQQQQQQQQRDESWFGEFINPDAVEAEGDGRGMEPQDRDAESGTGSPAPVPAAVPGPARTTTDLTTAAASTMTRGDGNEQQNDLPLRLAQPDQPDQPAVQASRACGKVPTPLERHNHARPMPSRRPANAPSSSPTNHGEPQHGDIRSGYSLQIAIDTSQYGDSHSSSSSSSSTSSTHSGVAQQPQPQIQRDVFTPSSSTSSTNLAGTPQTNLSNASNPSNPNKKRKNPTSNGHHPMPERNKRLTSPTCSPSTPSTPSWPQKGSTIDRILQRAARQREEKHRYQTPYFSTPTALGQLQQGNEQRQDGQREERQRRDGQREERQQTQMQDGHRQSQQMAGAQQSQASQARQDRQRQRHEGQSQGGYGEETHPRQRGNTPIDLDGLTHPPWTPEPPRGVPVGGGGYIPFAYLPPGARFVRQPFRGPWQVPGDFLAEEVLNGAPGLAPAAVQNVHMQNGFQGPFNEGFQQEYYPPQHPRLAPSPAPVTAQSVQNQFNGGNNFHSEVSFDRNSPPQRHQQSMQNQFNGANNLQFSFQQNQQNHGPVFNQSAAFQQQVFQGPLYQPTFHTYQGFASPQMAPQQAPIQSPYQAQQAPPQQVYPPPNTPSDFLGPAPQQRHQQRHQASPQLLPDFHIPDHLLLQQHTAMQQVHQVHQVRHGYLAFQTQTFQNPPQQQGYQAYESNAHSQNHPQQVEVQQSHTRGGQHQGQQQVYQGGTADQLTASNKSSHTPNRDVEFEMDLASYRQQQQQ